MDKKLVGAFLVTLIALVFTVSLRYTSIQSDQTDIPSPTPTLTPTPHALLPANLKLNLSLEMLVESTDRPRLKYMAQ